MLDKCPVTMPERINVERALKWQPYWFYKRFEFLSDDMGEAFYNPFRVQMFLYEFRVFYPQVDQGNYNGLVQLELTNDNSDLNFQVDPTISFHICSWGGDITASAAPAPFDLKALGINFSAEKLGSIWKFNIPFEYNTPIRYKISLLNGNRPAYFDVMALTYIESGRI